MVTNNGMLIGSRSRAAFKLPTISILKNPLAIHLINKISNQNPMTIIPSHFPKLFIFSRMGISEVPASSSPCDIFPISVSLPTFTVKAVPLPTVI